jgi:predicted secreted Zn-dependent protease
VREWERWFAATVQHEDRHRQILIDTARALSSQMSALPAAANCAELDEAAGRLGESLLRLMRKQHASFDLDTRHGESTGALLRDPP